MKINNIKLLAGKIHHAIVTECNLNYVGSIKIDELLLQAVGILPLEHVEIVNLTNGKRWYTYVLPGKSGAGDICPNGGGAYCAKPGDKLIIWSYVSKDRQSVLEHGHIARVVMLNEDNSISKKIMQHIKPDKNGYTFEESVE